MTLTEQLLKADVEKAKEKATGKYKSKSLAKALGLKKPVDITIKELGARRTNDLITNQLDKKGNLDVSKVFDTKALTVTEGVADPDLRDRSLLEKYGCATPKDLAILLFGNEINTISEKIIQLSGIDIENDEEEVKN